MSAGEAREANGGSTGREDGEELRCRDLSSCLGSSLSEGVGEELRTFEEVGVAEKDCSNGFNSRSKFDRVWRVCGAGDRDWLLGDMRDVTKMTNEIGRAHV